MLNQNKSVKSVDNKNEVPDIKVDESNKILNKVDISTESKIIEKNDNIKKNNLTIKKNFK